MYEYTTALGVICYSTGPEMLGPHPCFIVTPRVITVFIGCERPCSCTLNATGSVLFHLLKSNHIPQSYKSNNINGWLYGGVTHVGLLVCRFNFQGIVPNRLAPFQCNWLTTMSRGMDSKAFRFSPSQGLCMKGWLTVRLVSVSRLWYECIIRLWYMCTIE